MINYSINCFCRYLLKPSLYHIHIDFHVFLYLYLVYYNNTIISSMVRIAIACLPNYVRLQGHQFVNQTDALLKKPLVF